MAKGPPPKLYAVKRGAGNPGRRPLNPGPAYRVKRPNCPANLTGEGRKLFRQLAPELYQKSLLTTATIPGFMALGLLMVKDVVEPSLTPTCEKYWTLLPNWLIRGGILACQTKTMARMYPARNMLLANALEKRSVMDI